MIRCLKALKRNLTEDLPVSMILAIIKIKFMYHLDDFAGHVT